MNYNSIAKRVIEGEIIALENLKKNIPDCFESVVSLIISIKGKVVIMGIGKSGYIARKIASSLASTGTNAIFVHPTEASHGDLGMINKNDLVIIFSNSGNSHELIHSIHYCNKHEIIIVGVTMNQESILGRACDYILKIPQISEVSDLQAPTSSTIMMLSLGDALVIALHEAKNFTKEDYSVFHPGGQIGYNLLNISDIMTKKDEVPIVEDTDNLTKIMLAIIKSKCSYAIVENSLKKPLGIINYKNIEKHLNENNMKKIATELMEKNIITIPINTKLSDAQNIMDQSSNHILVVVNENDICGTLCKSDLENKFLL